jgi:hypothetical protein
MGHPPKGRPGTDPPDHAGRDQHHAGADREDHPQGRRHALLGGLHRAPLDGRDELLHLREAVGQYEQPGKHKQQSRAGQHEQGDTDHEQEATSDTARHRLAKPG